MSQTVAIVSFIAGVTIIIGALIAFIRTMLKIRDTFKDNIRATQANTKAIEDLMTNQVIDLQHRISELERKVK